MVASLAGAVRVETVDKHADDAEEEGRCREEIGHVSAVS